MSVWDLNENIVLNFIKEQIKKDKRDYCVTSVTDYLFNNSDVVYLIYKVAEVSTIFNKNFKINQAVEIIRDDVRRIVFKEVYTPTI